MQFDIQGYDVILGSGWYRFGYEDVHEIQTFIVHIHLNTIKVEFHIVINFLLQAYTLVLLRVLLLTRKHKNGRQLPSVEFGAEVDINTPHQSSGVMTYPYPNHWQSLFISKRHSVWSAFSLHAEGSNVDFYYCCCYKRSNTMWHALVRCQVTLLALGGIVGRTLSFQLLSS